jgi:hypothetical protein
MTITRKRFVGGATASYVLLLLNGCGGGGSSYGSPAPAPPPPVSSCGSAGQDIAGNHGHVLAIPSADLDSMVDKSYSIMGTAGHDHTVTFTPSQLATLKTHAPVTVTSTTTLGHQHQVTATCL